MKIFLRALLLTVIVVVIACALFLFAPYKKYEYVRVSDAPQTITVEYVNVTGSPTCSKLYLVKDSKTTSDAVLVRLPNDIPDPNRVTSVSDGKRLQITGYEYIWQATNRITGAVTRKQTGRFDVVSWRAPDGTTHKTQLGTSAENFEGKNYIDCLD